MMEIKKLKRLYEETSKLNVIFERVDEVSRKFKEAKAKADEAHMRFKKLSKGDKNDYKSFIEVSKRINELKKEQEFAYKNFLDSKKEFGLVNSQLKQKLVELREVQGKLSGIKEEREKTKKSKQEMILKEKVKGVEEKLRKRKKLTTEDLIVFQGNKEET